jgi:HEAT repeat protein
MPGKRQFEQQIAALELLRQAPPEARIEPLRKALANKNNFIAAKVAGLIREFNAHELIPDLVKAFDRFFENAEKSDPQCWAKNAISGALANFELQEPDIFLRGMRHIQLEPVWGGQSDTAGTLRATCALALVQCRRLPEPDLLAHLVDLLADKDKTVRTEVARAIDQVGSPSASLLLRLRASLGNDEPEVLGACFSGVLHIEGVSAIPWVSGFLSTGDDVAGEAALALAATHSVQAFQVLRDHIEKTNDPWFRSVLLSAIALTRQDESVEFLLELVKSESLDAEGAIEAILRAVPSEEVLQRLKELTSANARLGRVLAKQKKILT